VIEPLRAVVDSWGHLPGPFRHWGKVTALVATHDATLLDLADRVLELGDGEIVEH